jgi:1-deoxy-D-xylulose 5-phosphate reductoisomerase
VKRIAILGSTGSIGRSALAVVDAHPSRLQVAALAAGDNASLLAEQIATYRPSRCRDCHGRRNGQAACLARFERRPRSC